MARIFEFASDRRAWAMEVCEERAFIAVWCDIQPRIIAQGWAKSLEYQFFDCGNGLSNMHISLFNRELVRCGMGEYEIFETHVGDYVRDHDKMRKARNRCEARDAYMALDKDGKLKWKTICANQIAALPPPHHSFDEFLAIRKQQRSRVTISDTVVQPVRLTVGPTVVRTVAPTVEVNDGAERVAESVGDDGLRDPVIIKKLKMAVTLGDESLLPIIVSKIDPSDAWIVAEQIGDKGLQAMLLKRSLE